MSRGTGRAALLVAGATGMSPSNICFLNVIWQNSFGLSYRFSFGFQTPVDNSDMFGPWVHNCPRKYRSHVLIGAIAVCWAVWMSRNDIVFNKSSSHNALQVLFRATYWIRCWSKMSKEEEGEVLRKGCQQIEVTAMEMLNRCGWKHRNRIEV